MASIEFQAVLPGKSHSASMSEDDTATVEDFLKHQLGSGKAPKDYTVTNKGSKLNLTDIISRVISAGDRLVVTPNKVDGGKK